MSRVLPRLERYHRPACLDEARALLREGGGTTMVLGGGVSLGMIPRPHVREVVSLERLGLEWVRRDGQTLSLGAALTLGKLAAAMDRGCPVERLIRSATLRTATTPLRNLMTVGGVIAGAGPWSDLPVALLVADAQVVVDATCVLSLEELLARGPRMRAGSILTEVRIPLRGVKGGAFLKVGRNQTDLALASSAVAAVEGDSACRLRVAVGGLVTRPTRVSSAERYLAQGSWTREGLFEILSSALVLRPDAREDEEYRCWLAATCVADCLESVVEEVTR